jgi:hypothetical protein
MRLTWRKDTQIMTPRRLGTKESCLGFYPDVQIIRLAKKLREDCGVFGVASDEYLD